MFQHLRKGRSDATRKRYIRCKEGDHLRAEKGGKKMPAKVLVI